MPEHPTLLLDLLSQALFNLTPPLLLAGLLDGLIIGGLALLGPRRARNTHS